MKKLKTKNPIKVPHPNRYTVLDDDIDHLAISETYPKLVEKLQVDLKRAGDAKLRELIAQSPEDLRLAGYIYAVASEDYERVLDEYETLMGFWSVTARATVAKLKQTKKWDGATHKTDIERWVAANVPEHNQAKAVLRKSKRLMDQARRLFEAYQARLSSLQSYGKLVQKRKGLSVEQMHGHND